MKIIVERDLIEEAVFFLGKTANSVLQTKSGYRAVCFKFNSGHLRFYTSDGQHFCEYYYGAVEAPDSIYYVDHKLLEKIVITSKSDNLTLTFDENKLIIDDDESKYKLQYTEGIDYSYLFAGDDKLQQPVAKISMVDFLNIFPFMSVCVNKQAPIAGLRGLYYDGNFIATDTTALAFYPYADPIETPLFFTTETFRLLSHIARRVGTIHFYLINTTVLLVGEQFKYIVSLLSTTFPDYNIALEKKNNHKCRAIIDRDTLIAKCRRILTFTDAFNKPVTFIFNENLVTLYARSDTKEGRETLQIQTEGIQTELSFTVNVLNMISYLSRLFNDTVQMTFSDNPTEYAILDGVAFYIDGILK